MSVRKVYQLLLDGKEVWSGSYAQVVQCYNSAYEILNLLGDEKDHVLVIAFRPVLKGD